MKIFQLEITNDCKNNCEYCGHSNMIRPVGYISLETVEKVLKYIQESDDRYEINLWGYGEPLLHPNFFEIAKKFKDIGMITTVFTGASFINDDLIKSIIEDKSIDNFYISYNTTEKDDLIKRILDGRKAGIVGMYNHVYKENMETLVKKFGIENVFVNTLIRNKNGFCKFRNTYVNILWNEDVIGCYYDIAEGINKLGVLDDLINGSIKLHTEVIEKCKCHHECKTIKYENNFNYGRYENTIFE